MSEPDSVECAFEKWWNDGESAARDQSYEAQRNAFEAGWAAVILAQLEVERARLEWLGTPKS